MQTQIKEEMNYKGIIFDFDGTLADTNKGIVSTYKATFEEMGLPVPSTEKITSTIGLPLKDCFLAMDGTMTDAQADEAVIVYRRLFPSLAVECTSAFPGVPEMLKYFHGHGIKMAIATSRNSRTLGLLCSKLGIGEYFESMYSADDVINHKPAPDAAVKAMESMGLSADEVLVAGDATYDILMGKGAGCRTCACSWGNQSREMLQSAEPDFIIDSVSELISLVIN